MFTIKGEIFVNSEIGVNLINSFIYLLSVQLSVLSTFPFPSCLNFLILDHWAISYLPVLGIYRRQPTTNQNQQKLQKIILKNFSSFLYLMMQNICRINKKEDILKKETLEGEDVWEHIGVFSLP